MTYNLILLVITIFFEGSLEVKLPTIWTNEKGMGRVREEKRREEKRREKERRSKRESLRRKKIQAREKVGKSRNTLCFANDLWFRRVEK